MSDIAQEIFEEGLRMRECPGIYFATEPSGRTACVGPFDPAAKNALLKNQLYVNVHTVLWPLGEIRGQILRIK